MSVPDYFLERFTLDIRSLALYRVLLALVVVLQLSAQESVGIAGSAITAASLVTFLFGYRTRWSALVLWLSYAFFHANITTGLYPVVCGLLLLSVFLPLGRYAAFDDAMDHGNAEDGALKETVVNVTTVAAAAVVIFALIALFSIPWLGATMTPVFANFVGLSFVFKAAALAGPTLLLMLFLPKSLQQIRFWFSATLVVVLCLLAIYDIVSGISPVYALLVAALACLFLAGAGWDFLGTRSVVQSRHALRIYYDQPCGFCRKICFVFASFMLLGRCQIATAQSDRQAHKLLQDNDSWVVFDQNGNHALCWAAVLVLMRASPLWRPLGYLLTAIGMGVWGKPLYRLIGSVRGVLSKVTARVLPYRHYQVVLSRFDTVLVLAWLVLLALASLGVFNMLGLTLPGSAKAFGLW